MVKRCLFRSQWRQHFVKVIVCNFGMAFFNKLKESVKNWKIMNSVVETVTLALIVFQHPCLVIKKKCKKLFMTYSLLNFLF